MWTQVAKDLIPVAMSDRDSGKFAQCDAYIVKDVQRHIRERRKLPLLRSRSLGQCGPDLVVGVARCSSFARSALLRLELGLGGVEVGCWIV